MDGTQQATIAMQAVLSDRDRVYARSHATRSASKAVMESQLAHAGWAAIALRICAWAGDIAGVLKP